VLEARVKKKPRIGQQSIIRKEKYDNEIFEKQKQLDKRKILLKPENYTVGYQLDDFVVKDSESSEYESNDDDYTPEKKNKLEVTIPFRKDNKTLPDGITILDCLNVNGLTKVLERFKMGQELTTEQAKRKCVQEFINGSLETWEKNKSPQEYQSLKTRLYEKISETLDHQLIIHCTPEKEILHIERRVCDRCLDPIEGVYRRCILCPNKKDLCRNCYDCNLTITDHKHKKWNMLFEPVYLKSTN